MTLDEAIAIALAENMLDAAYADDVRTIAEQPESAWPRCCNSDCDPCVTRLIRAGVRAKALAAEPHG